MPFINQDGVLTDSPQDTAQAVPPLPLQQQPSMPRYPSQGMPPLPNPGPPPVPQDPDKRADLWRNLLADFTWSLGAAMSAGASAPPGQRNNAGFGAALTAPYERRRIQSIDAAKQALEAAQTEANSAKAERVRDQAINEGNIADLKRQFLTISQGNAKTIADLRGAQTRKADAQTQNIPFQNDMEARRYGQRIITDAEGNRKMEPIPADQLGAKEQGEIALNNTRKELDEAQAKLATMKADPKSPLYEDQRQRTEYLKQNLARLQRQQDANLFGTVNGQALPGISRTEEGEPIGIQIARVNNSGMTGQMKGQAIAALNTKDMTGIVRKYVEAEPDLIGPAAGRLNELWNRIGSNPSLANTPGLSAEQLEGVIKELPKGQTTKEQDAATLSGHLAYLFLNEARAALPGNRPASEYLDWMRQHSAGMQDNPAILEGFLRSAVNNADLSLKNIGVVAGRSITPAAPANPPKAPANEPDFIRQNGKLVPNPKKKP